MSESSSTLPKPLPAFRELVERHARRDARREPWNGLNNLRHDVEKEREAGTSSARLTEQRLLEIIREPRICRDPHRHLWYGQTAAIETLARQRSPGLSRVLKAWSASRDRVLRHNGVEALASMGRRQDVAFLRRLFRDGDAAVICAAGYVLAVRSLDEYKPDPGFEEAIREALAPCMWRTVRGTPAQRKEAYWRLAQALMPDEPNQMPAWFNTHLKPECPAVAPVAEFAANVAAMYKSVARRLSRAEIWLTYEAIRRRSPRSEAVGRLLVLGATVDPIAAARALKSLTKNDRASPILKPHLKEARRLVRGQPSFDTIRDRYIDGSLKLKPQPAAVLTAHIFAREILGDGVEGCFGNIGDEWRTAHKGMKIIGQDKAAAALERAAKIPFGSRRIRESSELVDAMTEAQRRAFDDAAEDLWNFTEGVLAAAEDYVSENPGKFQ